MQFCDRPEEFRQRVRGIVNDRHGMIDSYSGLGVQVMLPRDGWRDLLAELEAIGGRERMEWRTRYPAETGSPECLHHGRNGQPPEPSCGMYLFAFVEFPA